MRNKPNFQLNRLTVTLDMIRTYNDNCRKKRKKNKPKTHQNRTKIEQKTNENARKRAKFHPKNNPQKNQSKPNSSPQSDKEKDITGGGKTEKIGNCPLYRYNYEPQTRWQGG
jgi:hypothetical protein